MDLKSVLEPLKSMYTALADENKPVLLYGMGDGADKIFDILCSRDIRIHGVFASDGFVRGQSFRGFEVISLVQAEEEYGDFCAVLCFALEGKKADVLNDIRKFHKLYAPNLPVYGDGVFDKECILGNIEKVQKVYDILADDDSKSLFLDVLKFNITGDPSFMLDKTYGFDYPKGFFIHSKRHIDVGAFDGDTISEYISVNSGYKDIVGFEPDKLNYNKLKKNTAGLRSVICENSAVSDKDGFACFDGKGGRASALNNGIVSSQQNIITTSVDSYCNQKTINQTGITVGSIKIDAEGEDRQVLYGAVNTIYKNRPDISVAVYHRAADIYEIPLLLRKYDYSYKFFLRKKPYIPAWDIFLLAQATKN